MKVDAGYDVFDCYAPNAVDAIAVLAGVVVDFVAADAGGPTAASLN